MYNNLKYHSQTVDQTTLLESNFSNKINEIHNLLDSSVGPFNTVNAGLQFDVHFSMMRDNNIQYYVNPYINPQEYDLVSFQSYSNASSTNSSNSLGTNRFGRGNGNFKKYPLRSDKSFHVVPNLNDTNVSTEQISLKALSIGPDFYYKSDSHTIIDKMKATVDYLEILSTDRELLEILISKFNLKYQLPLCKPNRITITEPYNIKMYYHRVMSLLESEYLSLSKMCVLLAYMSQTVLSNLIVDTKLRKITMHEEKDFEEVLNDFLCAMNNLKKLNNLRIVMIDNFSQTVSKDEKDLLISAFDDMTFAIRQWHIMLWTIKEGICMIKITSTEQFEHFRNLFIGS